MVLQSGHYTVTSGSVHSRILSILIIGLLAFLTACNDDSANSADSAAPTAEIHFPGYYGLTQGDTVLVTGAATDASTITRVRVAGVDATSTDGFATWRATVPLEPGDNLLEVETTDEFSNIDTAAATLHIESSSILSPAAITLDAANNRLLVLEDSTQALVAIDLDSGKRSILSEDTSDPDGPRNLWVMWDPRGIILDAAHNRALLLIGPAVVAADLDSGTRSLLSLAPYGSDPGSFPPDFVLDSANNRALLVVGGAVVAVDLENGVQSILSPALPPITGGPYFIPVENALTAIALDAANNRALVTDANRNALVAVDLNTGSRTILSIQPDQGSGGPILTDPLWLYFSRDVTLDATRNRVLVVNSESSNLVAVDLTTGERSNFSHPYIPDAHFPFEYPAGIALDPANDRALVIDSHEAILAVDLGTGVRSVAYDRKTPDASNGFELPSDIVMDADRGRALVVDEQSQAVLAMDLATGARTVLSDNAIPDTNNPFESPYGITLDTGNNRTLVLDGSGVIAVDLDTGARSILAQSATSGGAANPLVWPSDITLDAAHNRALVTTRGTAGDIIGAVSSSMVSVDLDTGALAILSDRTAPDASNPFAVPLGIELDSAHDRALVVDAERQALMAVDLESGARTVLSNFEIPDTTNPLNYPAAIAVDPAKNRALVVDLYPFFFGKKLITSVDLATGVRTILSDGATPDTDNWFYSPASIALDAARNRALVVESQLRAVIAIELTSGERVIVSK